MPCGKNAANERDFFTSSRVPLRRPSFTSPSTMTSYEASWISWYFAPGTAFAIPAFCAARTIA